MSTRMKVFHRATITRAQTNQNLMSSEVANDNLVLEKDQRNNATYGRKQREIRPPKRLKDYDLN